MLSGARRFGLMNKLPLVLIAASLSACRPSEPQTPPPTAEQSARDAAIKAVPAALANPSDVRFNQLRLVHLTGDQGSKADVVCGEINTDKSSPLTFTPFMYVTKLERYRPDATETIATGEVQIFSELAEGVPHHDSPLLRQQSGRWLNFCLMKSHTPRTAEWFD
jgi:hypothetical protein